MDAMSTASMTPLPTAYGPTGAAAGSKVSPAQAKQIDKIAKDYEAGFVSAMLESMFAGVKTDKTFGGGQAEGMYRSLLNQEYGKVISQRGGLGIADSIKREMLHLQEMH